MENIKEKIAKLLALSGSPNEHEAAAALRLAHRLMEKYAISEAEAKGAPRGEIGSEQIDVSHTSTWIVQLANALAKANGCFCYYVPGKRIVIAGRADARRATLAEFNELRPLIDRLARRAGSRSAQQNAYRRGFVTRVAEEIAHERDMAQKEARTAGVNERAVMVVTNAVSEARQWTEGTTRLGRARKRGGNISDLLAFNRGHAEGAGARGMASRPKLRG